MKIRINIKLPLLLTILVTLVTSCGGSDKPDQFRMDTTHVEFQVTEGHQAPNEQSITGEVYGVNQSVYVFVDASSTPYIANAKVEISDTVGTLTLYPASPKEFDVGTFTSDVKVSVCFDANCNKHLRGSPANISVSYIIEDDPEFSKESGHLIYVPDNGIAFTKLQNKSVLNKTVIVKDSYNKKVSWKAVANQPWLSVSSFGVTGDELEIIADPSLSLSDGMHYAEIKITSENDDIENSDTIMVGLWVDNSSALEDLISLDVTAMEIASDPVRPYVYITEEGENINVYNIYTQELVKSYSDIGIQLSDMEVSSDGKTLYVLDKNNLEVIEIDLFTDEISNRWHDDGEVNVSSFTLLRHQGRRYVVMGDGGVYNSSSENLVKSGEVNAGGGRAKELFFDASLYGNRLCGINTGTSPCTIYCYDVSYDSYYRTLSFSPINKEHQSDIGIRGEGGNGKDVGLSADGTIMYTASGAPYNFVKYDLLTGLNIRLAGNAYPTAIDVDDDDNLHAGSSSRYGDQDVWVYNRDDSLRLVDYVSGYADNIRARQVVSSGDGYITIISSDDPRLHFLSSYK